MDIAVICFTKSGLEIAEKIKKSEDKVSEHKYECFYKCSTLDNKDVQIATSVSESVSQWAKIHFKKREALIFVGAMGIAVRAIADLISDKLDDSPVIVIDDKGRYVIPVLSGHVGGANEIANDIANVLNATPVITTSTDIHSKFAVDIFAKKNKLRIVNKEAIAKVSSKVLAGKKIVMAVSNMGCVDIQSLEKYKDEIMILKTENADTTDEIDVYIGEKCISEKSSDEKDSDEKDSDEKDEYLHLVPLIYAVGIGCKRGKTKEEIRQAVDRCLEKAGIDLKDIFCLASIDIKKDEAGIIELAKELRVDFQTFSAETLQTIEGDFSESEFVTRQVGVGNVCERAAIAACMKDGELILNKYAKDGVTVAVARKKWRLDFDYEK